jgi:hypothetical protein
MTLKRSLEEARKELDRLEYTVAVHGENPTVRVYRANMYGAIDDFVFWAKHYRHGVHPSINTKEGA